MRLIIYDHQTPRRVNFEPLALSRPIFELRCGMTSLAEKLIAKLAASDVAYFVPPYMAEVYRSKTSRPVNDPATLKGDDLLLLNGRVKAAEFAVAPVGRSEVAIDSNGDVLYARIARNDLGRLKDQGTAHASRESLIDAFLESAKNCLPAAKELPAVWNYTWDLVLANSEQLRLDFAAAGRSGIEGKVEEPHAIRGSKKDIYVAPGAVVHPMVVIDAEHGPVYLDEGVEVFPFTRIEGPCYVGNRSILVGAKCRQGNSIGPMCRVGGEIEESIIHGYTNKYHDGFLGHAYVGEWVNFGAMTSNSDLKNDYSNVSVVLDGRTAIDTGSIKIGSLIGDHAKTSIGTLFNTGAYVGAMTLLATPGRLMPKFIPSFTRYVDGALSEGYGKDKLYKTAKAAMSRRNCVWSAADEALWDAVHEMTAPVRDEAVRKGRK